MKWFKRLLEDCEASCMLKAEEYKRQAETEAFLIRRSCEGNYPYTTVFHIAKKRDAIEAELFWLKQGAWFRKWIEKFWRLA